MKKRRSQASASAAKKRANQRNRNPAQSIGKREEETPTPPATPRVAQQNPLFLETPMNSMDQLQNDQVLLTPQVSFSLSQGTMNQLMAETAGPISTAMLSADIREPTLDRFSHPQGYYASVGGSEALNEHTTPYAISIQTETTQVLGEDAITYSGNETLMGNNTTLTELHNVTQQQHQQPHHYNATAVKTQPNFDQPEEHTQIVRPAASTCAIPVSEMADYPSNTPFPGDYNLTIDFPKPAENESKKTISYKFVPFENKLYVRSRVHCAIHMRTSFAPPDTSRVRATVIYARPPHIGEVVKRCMNHVTEDTGKVDHPDHFVRCHNRGAQYEQNGACGRHSVWFPWESPSNTDSPVTGVFEFMCFSSCTGTINRRPLQMLLTLECGEQLLARQVFELKVCACPGRDADNAIALVNPSPAVSSNRAAKRKAEASNKTASNATVEKSINYTTVEPLLSPGETRKQDDRVYTVQVRGRELYKLVSTIIQNYELAHHYREIVQKVQETTPNASAGLRPDTNGMAPGPSSSGEAPLRKYGSTSNSIVATNVIANELTPDTTISSWLRNLDLAKYTQNFLSAKCTIMNDLKHLMSTEFLTQLAIPSADIQRIFASWISYNARQELLLSQSTNASDSSGSGGGTAPPAASGVSLDPTNVVPPVVKGPSQTSVSSTGSLGGYRVNRTTVKHLYHIPQHNVSTQHNAAQKHRKH